MASGSPRPTLADDGHSAKDQAAERRWKELLARLPADAPIRGMLELKIKEASASP